MDAGTEIPLDRSYDFGEFAFSEDIVGITLADMAYRCIGRAVLYHRWPVLQHGSA